MKKKNRFLVLLVLVLVLVISMTALVACIDPNADKDEKDDTKIETRDQLLANGTFYNSTSSTSKERYVKDNVSSWTKTSGAIGYSTAIMGSIDIKKLADNASLIWDTDRFKNAVRDIPVAPNSPKELKEDNVTRDYEDTYAGVIASTDKEASVYYSSSSAKLEKKKYYKLSIDVWTLIDNVAGEEGEGAYLFVTDGVYAEWLAIDTEAKWKTFELYVEANNFEDRSFSVQLWLGHGPSKIGTTINPRLTRGVAIFDNIILKEITDAEYAAIDQDALNKDQPYEFVKKESILFPDTEFEYNRAISSSSTASSTTKAYYSARVGAPYNYTQIVGKTDLSTDKPYVSSAGNSAPYGIFDLAKLYNKTEKDGTAVWTDTFQLLNTTEFTAPNYADFYGADGIFDNNKRGAAEADYVLKDSRALLIFNNIASGIGYKSDKKLLIETGKYYSISAYAYVYKTLNLPNKIVDGEGKATQLTKTQVEENQKAVEEYNANALKAHMKLTGASLKDAEELTKYTGDFVAPSVVATETAVPGEGETPTDKYTMTVVMTDDATVDGSNAKYGEWQIIEFFVKGNSLSNRLVNVEFWLGEGTKNDVSTLCKGGVIFDSLNIKAGDTPAELGKAEDDFEELSPFNFAEGNDYASLIGGDGADKVTSIEKTKTGNGEERTGYTLKFADGINSKDAAMNGMVIGADYIAKLPEGAVTEPKLSGLNKEDFGKWTVPKAGEKSASFNTLMLRNLDYTGSILTVNSTAPIYANNYYRLSMWVKTLGMEEGKGVTINLLLRNTESDYKTANVLTSFTAVNTKSEWVEYVFYINGNYVDTKDASGAKLDHNAVTVQFVMGTGDSYNPSTHMKGDLMVGALNIQGAITNTEYSSAVTGDSLKKHAFSSTISTEDTVSGGRFNGVDYDATIKAYTEKNQGVEEDKQLKAYSDTGSLIGVGSPSSNTWSQTNPVGNQVSTPTALNINNKQLSWTGSADAASYEIFRSDVLVGRVVAKEQGTGEGEEANYNEVWDRPFTTPGVFYVRAVPKDKSKKLISNKNSITTSTEAIKGDDGAAELPSYEVWSKTQDALDLKASETKDFETNFGIIDYKNLSQENLDKIIKNGGTGINNLADINNLYAPSNTKYGEKDPNDTRYFFGEDGILSGLYNNVLMLSSQYLTRGGYTMYSSTSLNSESYYEISVWVKTMGDATASFTIDNSTSTFYNVENTDYIGFNNIKTDGEWVQLKLYAKTGLASAALKLKLFMGDPYEKDYTTGKGLCNGSVFFDDISMKAVESKEAYEKLVEGKKVYDGDGTFFNDDVIQTGFNVYSDLTYQRNVYAYKFLEFSVDSFDVSTDSTTTATGKKPDDYSQTIIGENTTVSDASQARVAYGVYNATELNEEKFAYLYENFFTENNESPDWWGIKDINALKTFVQGFGDNTLVMANFMNNGMYYKSSSKSIKASSYYQISFYAKLKAAEWKKAEFRFYHGDDTTKYESIVIDGYNAVAEAEDFGFKKYTFYIKNESTSSVSSNYFTFNLGTKADEKTDYMTGMLVIDNVAISEVTADDYTAAVTKAGYENWSKEEIAKSTSGVNFTKFTAKTTDETPKEETKTREWTAQDWLILSTSLIGAMILIAVVVVLIRNFKKKHIKTKAPEVENNVKVEGFVKTKKDGKTDADRREFDD